MASDSGSNKRCRYADESAEFSETKRFRESNLILHMLDDDDDVGAGADVDHTVGDLADVIKILECEIAAPALTSVAADGARQLDLGYLLEASDDELGIPPPAGSSPCSLADGVDVVGISDDEPDVAGFDRIWGFEDDVLASPYDGIGFGIPTDFDDGVSFDGRLFDYSDVIGVSSDAEDFPWLTESLAAV